MTAHLAGRKHAERVRGDSSGTNTYTAGGRTPTAGVCFYYPKGTCFKGDACTYRHEEANHNSARIPSINTSAVVSPGDCYNYRNGKCFEGEACTFRHESQKQNLTPIPSSILSSSSSYKRKTSDDDLVTEIILCKGGPPKTDSLSTNGAKKEHEKKLAPLFAKATSGSKEKAIDKKKKQEFPEEFANVFYRKRGVNLYIKNELVVWEFAYNLLIMRAIKTHIKGRAWNPGLGCWTCPLESLPDAIALYSHMGRTPDKALVKRAKEIEESYEGTSATDAIKLSIRLALKETMMDSAMSMSATFFYDAHVVETIKMLPPSQRKYNPATKAWNIDLYALPSLLEFLEPLGYFPSKHLMDISESCQALHDVIYNKDNDPSEVLEWNDDWLTESEEDMKKVDPAAASILEDKLKDLVALVGKQSTKAKAVNRSDYGDSKRRRLTSAQRDWSFKSRDYDDSSYSDDWSDDEDDFDVRTSSFFEDHVLASYARNRLHQMTVKETSPVDCDCGRPWKKMDGKHMCRYFGTYHCSCGNRWASAYCWKDETQACRSCNSEQLPIQKDQLEGKLGNSTGGAHDSSRCAMCRRLGRDCSM